MFLNLNVLSKFNKKHWMEKELVNLIESSPLVFYCHYNNAGGSFEDLRRKLSLRGLKLRIIKNSILKRVSSVENTAALVYSLNKNLVDIDLYLYFKTLISVENCAVLFCKFNSIYISVDNLENLCFRYTQTLGVPLNFVFWGFIFKSFFLFFLNPMFGFKNIFNKVK